MVKRNTTCAADLSNLNLYTVLVPGTSIDVAQADRGGRDPNPDHFLRIISFKCTTSLETTPLSAGQAFR